MQVVLQQLAGMKTYTAPRPIVFCDLLHQNELLKSGSHVFNFPNAGVSGRKTLLLCTSPWYIIGLNSFLEKLHN